jgi:hypothetical protein
VLGAATSQTSGLPALFDDRPSTPKEVVQPSGHGTIRLIISEMSDVQAVRDLLRQLGLKKVLDAGQEQDRWGYEEACLPQV